MDQWGVHIDEYSLMQALKQLDRPQCIFTPNPEILLEARKNLAFRKALSSGTLMLPDGHGLLLVSSLQRFPRWARFFLFFPSLILFLFWKKPFCNVFPEVIHGSDFMAKLVEWSAAHKKSVFFLGAGPGVAEKTADVFQKKYPELKMAGFSELDPSEEAARLVQKSRAEVLFVAYGAPKQEEWIARYSASLKLFHTMAVGGSFDFWSGSLKRAPLWMRKLGLEWLWRLFLQPRKRLKRIFDATVRYPLLSLFSSD